MYVSLYNKSTNFCHVLLLGAQWFSTLPGCNGSVYLIVDTTLQGPCVRKEKEAAAWGRDCRRHGQIYSSTQGAPFLSYTEDFIFFFLMIK